jgi:excinuclease UvrABC nuclease subunit
MIERKIEKYDFTREEMKPFDKISGIYAIIYNDKVIYVGQSTQIGKRLQTHSAQNALQNTIHSIESDINNGFCSNRCKAIAMYAFIAEHRDVMEFAILKETTDLDKWEEHYISLFKPRYNYQGIDIPYKRAN